MIVVTGGAGFIGSNLVHALNARGLSDILVVDNLENGDKFKNLVGARIRDYVDKADFLATLPRYPSSEVEAVLHQGACSSTTVRDGRYMLRNNTGYSKLLLEHFRSSQFIYASSAAVYGAGPEFREEREHERPLNVYGYSKWLFDEIVRREGTTSLDGGGRRQVVGLRYFNVYGPREAHKGAMASVAFHFHHQLRATGRVRVFEGSDGYGPGEQRRDFIHVDDVVDVILWFLDHRTVSGIYNVGTGESRSFNAIAHAVVGHHRSGQIEYIPFPDSLRGRYQAFTQADVSRLREAGYAAPFRSLEDGTSRYLSWLTEEAA